MRSMIFSANISKALCIATMGIALMMPAQVAAATPEMAVEAQTVNAQGGITVFSNKDAQYRIPAIVECKSGKLIAFTDHRYHNKDIGGGRHLDIVMKTSMDKGATWSSPEQMVAKGGNGIATSFDCAHGDAAVVVDKKSGRILLMCASGGIGYWESKRGHLLMMGRYYSDDDGKTWYGEEVTKQIYDLMPEVESAFFTSGRICQSKQIKVGKYYRVYTVLCTRSGNRILYSDDFGQNWKVLGKNVATGEGYRDFADVTGISSRALIQGLYGITPNALEGECILRPGFPAAWDSASVHTPYLDYSFKRVNGKEICEIRQNQSTRLRRFSQRPLWMI